jgi:triphosphoribosyl-dephospho-CoA synthase
MATTGSREKAAVQALFALIAHVDDTNLLWRGGVEGLMFARSCAEEFLARGGVTREDWLGKARAVHKQFVERNLSPGGSADLLGVTLFLDGV